MHRQSETSREPPKAHTHKKRQPTHAGQQRCMSREQQLPNQGGVHASYRDTTHASHRIVDRIVDPQSMAVSDVAAHILCIQWLHHCITFIHRLEGIILLRNLKPRFIDSPACMHHFHILVHRPNL